ncbi:MAG: hypothetical protein HQL15_10155, partial [Candidatus Omnitrophica bacterium]|nr:hypothetical protein [Candidatus Omnitrophota bacterium]
GEFFTNEEVERHINPDNIEKISLALIKAIDPRNSLEKAIKRILLAINQISKAAQCNQLYIYLPDTDEEGKPKKTDGRYTWTCVVQKGKRPSKVMGKPFNGEKQILELRALNKREEKSVQGVFEYKNGVCVIHDRIKFYEYLQKKTRFKEVMLNARNVLEEDLMAYKEEGNSGYYAYVTDKDNNPLFVVTIIGPLSAMQRAVIDSGLWLAKASAERVRMLHVLKTRNEEFENIKTERTTMEDLMDRLREIFHALEGEDSFRFTTSAMGREENKSGAQAARLGREIAKAREALKQNLDDMVMKMNTVLEASKKETYLTKMQRDQLSLASAGVAHHSGLDIFYKILTAEDLAELQLRCHTLPQAIGNLGTREKDIQAAFNVAMRYYQKMGVFTKIDELFKNDFFKAMEDFRQILKENREQLLRKFKELEMALLDYRREKKSYFYTFALLPEELKNNILKFSHWVRSDLTPQEFLKLNKEQQEKVGSPQKTAYIGEDKLSREDAIVLRTVCSLDALLPLYQEITGIAHNLISLEKERVDADLVHIVRKSIHLGIHQARVSQVEVVDVSFESNVEKCRALIDPGLNFFVFSEFVKNLLKYKRDKGAKGKVILEANKAKGYARISFKDNGVGISQTDRDTKLFIKGQRLEKTQKLVSGTGFGLSNGRQRVLDYGGQLVLEDSVELSLERPDDDSGSTFTIYLPIGHRTSLYSEENKERILERIRLFQHIAQLGQLTLLLKNLIQKIEKRNRSVFARRGDLEKLSSHLVKMDEISRVFGKMIEKNEKISEAYLMDTLERRVKPLVGDMAYVRGLFEDITLFFNEGGVTYDAIGELFLSNDERHNHGNLFWLYEHELFKSFEHETQGHAGDVPTTDQTSTKNGRPLSKVKLRILKGIVKTLPLASYPPIEDQETDKVVAVLEPRYQDIARHFRNIKDQNRIRAGPQELFIRLSVLGIDLNAFNEDSWIIINPDLLNNPSDLQEALIHEAGAVFGLSHRLNRILQKTPDTRHRTIDAAIQGIIKKGLKGLSIDPTSVATEAEAKAENTTLGICHSRTETPGVGRAVIVRTNHNHFEVWCCYGVATDARAKMRSRAEIATWQMIAEKEENSALRPLLNDVFIPAIGKPFKKHLYNSFFWMKTLVEQKEITDKDHQALLGIYENRYRISNPEDIDEEIADLKSAEDWMLEQVQGTSGELDAERELIKQLAYEVRTQLESKTVAVKFIAPYVLYKRIERLQKILPADMASLSASDKKAFGAVVDTFIKAVEMIEVLKHRRFLGGRDTPTAVLEAMKKDEIDRLELAWEKAKGGCAISQEPVANEIYQKVIKYISEKKHQVGFAIWKAIENIKKTHSVHQDLEQFVSKVLVLIDREFISDEPSLTREDEVSVIVVFGNIVASKIKNILRRYRVVGVISDFGSEIAHLGEELNNNNVAGIFGVPTKFLERIKEGDTVAVIPKRRINETIEVNRVILTPSVTEIGEIL